jgi:O6-methylguanine-DNA--protein-cysteine methyltransferase
MILSKRYLKKMNNMIMTSYQLAKNLPTVTLVAHQGCLIALDWHTQKTHDLLAKLLAKFKVKVAVMNSVALSHSIDADAKVLVETITQLKEYQAGQRQVFDMPIAIYHRHTLSAKSMASITTNPLRSNNQLCTACATSG